MLLDEIFGFGDRTRRFQILIEEEQYRFLADEAGRRGISI